MRTEDQEIPWLGLVVFLVPVALNLPSLFGWWLFDDPQIVLFAMRSSAIDAFSSTQIPVGLSTITLTPLLVLSFKFDLFLFGPNAVAFHAHQIISFAVAAYLFYRLVGRFTRPFLASLAALGLAGSATARYAVEMLGFRHCVEGLLFALLALLFWESESTDDEWWSGHRIGLTATFAGGAYLLAMFAAGVYAALPALFISISLVRKEPWRRVVPRLVPASVAAIAYLSWRWLALGSLMAHADLAGTSSWTGLWTMIAGSSEPLVYLGTLSGFVLFLLILMLMRFRPSVVIAVVIFLSLPFAAALSQTEMQHVLIPVGALMALGGIAANVLYGSRIGSMTVLIWVFLFALGGQAHWRGGSDSRERMKADGEYVATRPSRVSTLYSESPESYVDGIARMRLLSAGDAAPAFLLSKTGLLVEDLDLTDVVAASKDGSIGPLPENEVGDLRRSKDLFEGELLRGVRLERKGTDISWSFEPDCHCSWTFLSFPHYDETTMARVGSRVVPAALMVDTFRIRVDDSNGRWSISPLLRLPEVGREIVWSK